jgi:Tol biopolymer transport system component
VNDSAGGASNPYVDPDERYVIFSSARPGGLGRSDLWVAYRRADGAWGPAQNLGPRVNTADVEFCPTVSPDGRWLLFSRIRHEGERQVADDIYVVGVDALPPPAP